MPSVIGTIVTSNYLKAGASTKFGTRELAFFSVDMKSNVVTESADPYTGLYESDSLFSKAIRAIQQNAEVYGVGEPSGHFFTVIVAINTAADNVEDRNFAWTLQDAVRNGTGVGGAEVTALSLVGAALV